MRIEMSKNIYSYRTKYCLFCILCGRNFLGCNNYCYCSTKRASVQLPLCLLHYKLCFYWLLTAKLIYLSDFTQKWSGQGHGVQAEVVAIVAPRVNVLINLEELFPLVKKDHCPVHGPVHVVAHTIVTAEEAGHQYAEDITEVDLAVDRETLEMNEGVDLLHDSTEVI